jgi:catechol 2,3-dioxygenase-like lactoylglutathione lyase family enzyme
MATKSIHHHKFMVSDLSRSVAFYRDLLGFELMYEAERANLPAYDTIIGFPDIRLKIALLKLPDESILALIEYLNPPARTRELQPYFVGSSALCLVVDDIAADHRRLSAAGARFQSPPVDIVRDGKLAAKACYLYDPDGISLELYEMPAA